jgi:hypothetical protein
VLDEQLRSRRTGYVLARCVWILPGHSQGCQPHLSFSVEQQRLTAGDQQLHTWAGIQDTLGQLGAGVDDMLAVVQHEQQPARPYSRWGELPTVWTS